MRLDILTRTGIDPADTELRREVGAVVARAAPAGGLAIEFGPADGAPLARLGMSKAEAQRLCNALESILKGRTEEVIITAP